MSPNTDSNRTRVGNSTISSWAKLVSGLTLGCLVIGILLLGCRSNTKSEEPKSSNQQEGQANKATGVSKDSIADIGDPMIGDSSQSPDETSDETGLGSGSEMEHSASEAAEGANRAANRVTEQGSMGAAQMHIAGVAGPPAGFASATWTTKRLFALSPTGPCLIDLQVAIDGQSLEQASRSLTKQISEELSADMGGEVTWENLLEHPLVRSGWLGNLVAEDEQESQLVSMYDSDQDQSVALDELEAFLSRGLSRNDPLQVSDIGTAPDAVPNESPWGPVDEDGDYTLNTAELETIERSIKSLDYNGDSIVALAEINSRSNTTDMSMRSMSMLDMSTMIAGPGPVASSGSDSRNNSLPTNDSDDDSSAEYASASSDTDDRDQDVNRVAKNLLDHYTFLDGIPREQWSRWTDARWELLDQDGDQRLVRSELRGIADLEPDVRCQIMLPSLDAEAQSTLQSFTSFNAQNTSTADGWAQSEIGGRIATTGFVADLLLDDSYSASGRMTLRQQLGAALKDAQLRTFFTTQLQLQEDAFDLIDSNENQELDDDEFANAWRWLTARQGTRLLARWMVSPKPWFLVLDENGDRRLSSKEMQDSRDAVMVLDRNADGRITPDEMPLLVQLELRRSDNRLRAGALGDVPTRPQTEMPADWFSAMDSNGDGFIGHDEFLGEPDDFERLDRDADGFLVRSEVY